MKKFLFFALCSVLSGLAALPLFGGTAKAFAYPTQSSGIVIEADSGRILGGFHYETKLPMASTTKVLTAITVIESVPLDRVVTVPAEAAGVEGSSVYLKAGEKLTVKDLLYGLMLRSGNDCAVTLAVACSGSVEKFAGLMNETAGKAGAVSSHFVNPHGLHHDNHYTTAKDLALITAYALKNKDFAEIVSAKQAKIPGPDYTRVLINKNKMLSLYPGATGVKTGFTKKAGRCLVSSATRNNVNLVCVVLNCGDMWERSMALMDQAFSENVSVEVLGENAMQDELEVLGTDGKTVRTYTKNARRITVKKGTEGSIRTEKIYNGRLIPPIAKEIEIGKFQVYYENQLIFSEKIYTMDSVEANSYGYYLKTILRGFFG